MNAEIRGAGARLSFVSGSGTLEGSRIQVGNPEDLGMRGSFLTLHCSLLATLSYSAFPCFV
jgi:hypothetical protein